MNKKIKLLENCVKIKNSTTQSMNHLFEIYDVLKGNKKGSPTDKQQDLLRSIVILVCAGLDSFLKQIINDCLNEVRKKNPASQKFFINKTKEILQKPENQAIDLQVMSEILMSGDTETNLSKKIMSKMTEKSLQSYGELLEIGKSFGLGEQGFLEKKDEIRKMFNTRNKIAHEFDYNFRNRITTNGIKVREQRKRSDAEDITKTIYYIMDKIINKVEDVLKVSN